AAIGNVTALSSPTGPAQSTVARARVPRGCGGPVALGVLAGIAMAAVLGIAIAGIFAFRFWMPADALPSPIVEIKAEPIKAPAAPEAGTIKKNDPPTRTDGKEKPPAEKPPDEKPPAE